MGYTHLSIMERGQLETLHRLGWSARAIARHLRRHHGTIAREIKRGGNGTAIAIRATKTSFGVEGGMPQLVTKEDFQKAQEKMNQNKRQPGAYKAKEMYLLSGLIVCGECLKNVGIQYAMMGNTKYSGRNKLKYVTYRCGNRDRTKACKNPELRREYIESYVLSQLQEKIFNDEAIPVLAKQLNEYQKSKRMSKPSNNACLRFWKVWIVKSRTL